ncbi:MAG: porin [Gallionella sp.]|jgi:predicted porin|nr:porin [Gallionella sp.]
MQKKIIALAIAAAFAAPAAFADTSNVTVYGVANVSYDMTKTGASAANPTLNFSSNKVSSNTSRIGFKGTEDLGDGLSAIWQIESKINIDGGAASALADRNTFAGLSSKTAGTVLLGRHDTPYNLSNRKYDLFADGMADNRSIMGGGANAATLATATVGASFNGRQPNVVAYISPAMSGLTAAIAYVAGAEAQALAANSKGSAWSLAAMYGNGPVTANFGYEVHNLGTAGTGTVVPPAVLGGLAGMKETAWTISGGYKVEAFEINAIYEKTSDNYGAAVALPAGSNVLGHRAYYLSGKYNVSANDAVKLAYANAGSGVSVNTGATQISLGYDHSLSKRTTVYAAYTKLSNDTNGVYALSANGTGAPTVGGSGAKPSAISLGMKHTF